MDTIYRELILDHYKNPQNFGTLKNASASATENVVSCGDQLSMELSINDGKIADIKFHGTGCAISIASASILTEHAKGQQVTDLKRMSKDDILKLLGIELMPTRLKCAMLSLEVLLKAIQGYSSSESKASREVSTVIPA